MTPLYNQYLRPIGINDEHTAKIAFVQTPKGIITKRLFYVKFVDRSKDGFYYDSNNYLSKLYVLKRNLTWKSGSPLPSDEVMFLEISNNRITNIAPSIKHFSYIKVIKDKINPQLEGTIFILNFGSEIYNIINNSSNYGITLYKKVFHISMKRTRDYGYPNYRLSCFTDEDMTVSDNTLDLESDIIKYKTINIVALERKEKLQKLKNLNDEIEEWICE